MEPLISLYLRALTSFTSSHSKLIKEIKDESSLAQAPNGRIFISLKCSAKSGRFQHHHSWPSPTCGGKEAFSHSLQWGSEDCKWELRAQQKMKNVITKEKKKVHLELERMFIPGKKHSRSRYSYYDKLLWSNIPLSINFILFCCYLIAAFSCFWLWCWKAK